jgi:hypothetical protein
MTNLRPVRAHKVLQFRPQSISQKAKEYAQMDMEGRNLHTFESNPGTPVLDVPSHIK